MSRKAKLWATGIGLAALGLLMARIIPSLVQPPVVKLYLFPAGIIVATAGLAVILAAIRRG